MAQCPANRGEPPSVAAILAPACKQVNAMGLFREVQVVKEGLDLDTGDGRIGGVLLYVDISQHLEMNRNRRFKYF